MKTQIFRAAQFKTQAWKNGGGSTLELYRYPDNDQYDLRLSIATVGTSGPFSKFPGFLRTIIQLQGAPMQMRHPNLNRAKTLELHNPYNFDGEWETDCDVTEVARDFNVIYRKTAAGVQTSVQSLEPNGKRPLPRQGNKIFVYCLQGAINISADRESVVATVHANELCIIDRKAVAEDLAVTANQDGARVIVVMQSVIS